MAASGLPRGQGPSASSGSEYRSGRVVSGAWIDDPCAGADEYHRFRQRFKSLIDQYELRELHFHSLMRTKELEVQYNMARYERERKMAEQEAAKSRALNAQVLTFSKTESELRSQLNIYVDKFKQVCSPSIQYLEV